MEIEACMEEQSCPVSAAQVEIRVQDNKFGRVCLYRPKTVVQQVFLYMFFFSPIEHT